MTNEPGSDKEPSQKEWRERADRIKNDGTLQHMVDTELFNISWELTVRSVIKALSLKGNELVLEAGCGWGRVLTGIKHYLPDIRLEGIDLVQTLVDQANDLIRQHGFQNARAAQGDLLDLSRFDASTFDAIYSTRVLHYIEDKESAMRELYRVLKPSGSIIVAIPNRYCPYRWLTYRPLYSIYRLRDLMARIGFSSLQTGSFGFFPPAFAGKTRHSPLVRVDSVLSSLPLINRTGGLAYVKGVKPSA